MPMLRKRSRRGTEADQLSTSAPARRRVWGFRGQEQFRSQENPEMALHWSIERVTDWQQLVENDEQREITEAIVWPALVYDLSGVTEKNIDEWLFRQEFARRVDDFYPITRPRSQVHKRDLFTRAELERRIGLSTNVTTTSRAAFQKKLIEKVASDVDRVIRAERPQYPCMQKREGAGPPRHPASIGKASMQPMKLAEVRKHTGRQLTYAEAITLANP